MDDLTIEIKNKILENKELSSDEREEIAIYGIFGEKDRVAGEPLRWTTPMTTIFEIEDQLYGIDWERGNTENQENEFFEDPYKVKEVEKVIKTYEKV